MASRGLRLSQTLLRCCGIKSNAACHSTTSRIINPVTCHMQAYGTKVADNGFALLENPIIPLASVSYLSSRICTYGQRHLISTTTTGQGNSGESKTEIKNPELENASSSGLDARDDAAPRIKFKRLSKTARHIMQLLDKEAVATVKKDRDIPDIQPGYILQFKVEVPENKRRVQIVKGIVIARRNAGLNTTFRIRRMVANVGIESVYHLYSPNIKEIKVLDKKKVRRAKLYYLRDKMISIK